MKRLALTLSAVAMIAAPLTAVTIANPASDQLTRLSSLQRRAALRGGLLDSGYACARVEKSAVQGPWKNMIMWRAQCSAVDPRYDYAVFVGPDGSIQARPCQDLVQLSAQLKLPVCRPFSATKPSH